MTTLPQTLPAEPIQLAVAQTAGKSSKSKGTSRLDWVDCCKGICIVLVVYGHVTGGLEAAGTVREGSIFDQLRSWVYLFHMPAFFFLSGLFASKNLRRPFLGFVLNKLGTLVYPYVLWTGIYLGVQEVMAHYVNNAPDPGMALKLLWQPYGYGLWFLYSLFLISLLFQATASTRLPRGGLLLIALVLHAAAAFNVFGFWPILNQALLHYVFYAVGGLYAKEIFAWLAVGRTISFLAVGLLLLGLLTALALGLGILHLQIYLLPALLGVAGVVALARAVADSFGVGLFSLLGFYSLEIYLGHPLFSTASRAIEGRLGFHGALPLVASGLVAGLFLSLALGLACRWSGFAYLYRWPSRPSPANP